MKTILFTAMMLFFMQFSTGQEWKGKYTSNRGEITLSQQGNNVTGNYSSQGIITGTVRGNTVIGTFRKGSQRGTFSWTKTNDGFQGSYKLSKSLRSYSWNGKKVKENPYLISSRKIQNNNNVIKKTVVKDYALKPRVFKQAKPQKVLISKSYESPAGGRGTFKKIDNNFTDDIVKTSLSGDGRKSKENGENCVTTNKKLDISTSTFSFLSETGSPSYMLPGNMFRYESILDGGYNLVTHKRNPINLYIRDVRGQESPSFVTVENPHEPSQLNRAVYKLASSNYEEVAANMSFEMTEISSVKELGFSLTGNYSNKAAKIAATVGLKAKSKKDAYYLLIKFQQSMFNISVDDNISGNVFENPESQTDEMVFISDVTYGRKGYMLIKTSKSLKQINATLDVNYDGPINKGGIDAAFDYLKTDNRAEVKIFFYGGDSDGAAQSMKDLVADMSNGKTSFTDYIKKEAGNSKKALPIAYQLKNLNGDQMGLNTVLNVSSKTCIPNKDYELKINFASIKNEKSDDSDKRDDYCIEFTPELELNGNTYQLAERKFLSDKGSYNSRNAGSSNDLFVYNASKNQLAVREGSTEYINNSGVFDIPANSDLKNAKLRIKFRIWEASGKNSNGSPKLNRLVGISKSGSYNYHNFDLSELMQVLNKTKQLDSENFTECGNSTSACKNSPLGNYGKSKFYVGSTATVPMKNIGGKGKPVLAVSETMLNGPKSRSATITYTLELVD